MLKKLLYGIIILLVVYLALCFAGPNKTYVIAKKNIQATPAAIFSQIVELRNMKNWSKWILEDSLIELTYPSQTAGIGGSYSWKSKKSGEGSMTIKSLETNKMIAYELAIKDWNTVSDVKMDLTPANNSVDVTWTLEAQKETPFYFRGMMLLMNMNGMIKKDFEKGLDNLSQYLKTNPTLVSLNGFTIQESNFKTTDYLTKRATVKMQDIPTFFGNHLPEIGKAAGSSIVGFPCGIFWKWDEASMTTDMAAAMPVSSKNISNETYSVINLPNSKEYVLNYYGAYDKMKLAYESMDSVIKMNGYANPETVIEEYITDPMVEKDTSKWLTKIHFLVK